MNRSTAAGVAGLLVAAGTVSAACGIGAASSAHHETTPRPAPAHLVVQPAPAPAPAPRPAPEPAPRPAPAPGPAPAPQPAPAASGWHAARLVITAHSLGGVQVGMTLAQAEQAAGATFDGSGDGFRYPVKGFLPQLGERFVGMTGGVGPDGGTVACVGAWRANSRQSVSTPEGISIGSATEEIPEIYGSDARYVPPPAMGGMTDFGGWVVSEDGGTLVFISDPSGQRVEGIMGGGPGLGPNSCTG